MFDEYRVACFRWFPHDGASFAVHPWYHERKHYEQLTAAVAAYTRNNGPTGSFVEESPGGGWYVGERRPDADPIDPQAASRGGAFVVVVAYLPDREQPDRGQQARVRERLAALPLPERAGRDESLRIRVPRPVVPPPPPPPPPAPPPDGLKRPAAAADWPYVAIACATLAVALIFLADPIARSDARAASPGLVAALLGAVGGLLLAVGLVGLYRHFVAAPHAALDRARRLEEEWKLYRTGRKNIRLAPQWVGVTAGGQVLRGSVEPDVLRAEFPDLLRPDFAPLVRAADGRLEIVGRDATGREWYHVFEVRGEDTALMLFAGTVPQSTGTPSPVRPFASPPLAEPVLDLDVASGSAAADTRPTPPPGYPRGTRFHPEDRR